MRIEGARPGRIGETRRKARPGAFTLPGVEAPAASEATSVSILSHIGSPVALPDSGAEAAQRRRLDGMLDTLTGLQAALLGGQADPDALQRLAELADAEAGRDPGLARIASAIALRARVEIARWQRMQASLMTIG